LVPDSAIDALRQVIAALTAEQPPVPGRAELAEMRQQVPGQCRVAGHGADLSFGAVLELPRVPTPSGPGEAAADRGC
jgi:uncharacterized protein YhdP